MLEKPDFPAHSLVSESNNDVVHLRDMLEEAEKADAVRKAEKAKSWAGEIWEESKHSEQEDAGISDWIKNIREKDDELKKSSENSRGHSLSKLPPIRNSSNMERKIQAGPSAVELEKKSQVKENSSNKKRLNYSYDYFKEWDKFDVDKELKELEEEEKRLEEERRNCPKTADPGSEVHSDQTYRIEAMTPLEKRVAAQREKEKGNECMKCGETNAAVAYYSKSLELVPGDHLVLGNRAQAYLAIHCYLQAELDCDKALSIEPSYTKARYRRAVARKEQECVKRIEAKKKEEEERQREEEERRRYESAPRHKISIQEVEGDDDDDDGMDKNALDQAREAVRLKREAEDKLLKKEAAQRKKDEGNEAFKRKDLQAATRLYSEAINLYPSDDKDTYVALSNRALVYLQQERFKEAEEDCNKAIECNSKWAKAWHRRGVARAALDRREDALKDLERALMLEPDSKQTLEEIRKLRAKKAEASKSDFLLSKGSRFDESSSARPRIVELPDANENQGEKRDFDSNSTQHAGQDNASFKLEENRGSGSNQKMNRVEIIEDEDDDDVPVQGKDSAPEIMSGKMNRIQILEDDESDDEIDRKDERLQAPTACKPAQSTVIDQDEEGDVLDDDCACTDEGVTSFSDVGRIRINVEEDSDDDDDDDDDDDTTEEARDFSEGQSGMVRVSVEEDSDDDSTRDEVSLNTEDAAVSHAEEPKTSFLSTEKEVRETTPEATCRSIAADAQEPVASISVTLWGEADGRDFQAVQAARALKEEGDKLMRQGMFEAAAERYSAALDTLGDGDEVAQERRVCFSNRAGCRLQLRDYTSVIADCGEVLALDEGDVKALVRRGLAYEGLEKLAKASADVRTALGIEYATAGAGGRLSNFGQMARQCLERCHRACPEVCPLTIPVQPAAPAQSKAGASLGEAPRPARADGGSLASTDPASAAAEPAAEKARSSAPAALDAGCEAGKPARSGGDGPGSADGKSEPSTLVAPVDTPEPASLRDRRVEAESLKARGNEAFEAGRYQAAAMYYSGALDLMDDVPAYATNLAAAYVMLKNWPQALAAADRSLAMDAGNAKAHYRRAQALEGLGRLEEAVEAYQSGLDALPSSEALAKGLRAATERLQARRSAADDALAKIRQMEGERQRRAAEGIKAAAAAAKEAAARAPPHETTAARPTGPAAAASPGPAGGRAPPAAAASAGAAVPKSGAEFRKTLRGVRRDAAAAMAYLRLVGPARLAGLLAAGIEEEELVPVLQALDASTQGAVEGAAAAAAAAEAFGLLEAVGRAGRVTIACAMLDRKETARLQALLLRLHPSKAGGVPYSVDDWARVRVSFGV